MAYIICFLVFDVWVSLCFLRTHYIIDFLSGYAVARDFHRLGEKLCYFLDVKLLGYRRENRFSHYYDPCPKCGWGNERASLVTSKEEIEMQKRMAALRLAKETKKDDEDNGQASISTE